MNGIQRLKAIGISNTYIIHPLKGYEWHEERINELFPKIGIPYTFITKGDPSLITPEISSKYFVDGIDSHLSIGIKSCTLNHIYAYEKIIENGDKFAIIFENDPFFLTDFVADLEKMSSNLRQLPAGFIASIENTTLRFPSFWQAKPSKYFYRAKLGRAAGAYIIDNEAAKKILNDLKTTKCHTVIDWWHNSLIERGIVRMYWSLPALVEQGSHNGKLNSTISSKAKSPIRQLRWRVQKFFKYTISRLFNNPFLVD